MKTVTPTQLRTDIYNLLDEVLKTGCPLEIRRGGRKLRIVPVDQVDKLENLIARPEVIRGDPDDLVKIDWSDAVYFDFP